MKEYEIIKPAGMGAITSEDRNLCGMEDVIEAFLKRGWAPYEAHVPALESISSPEYFAETVKDGHAETLEEDRRYVLLPYVTDDTDVDQVFDALTQMHKMPMFHDLPPREKIEHVLSKGQLPQMYGIHPIDSFMFDENLHLIVDKRLYEVHGIRDTLPNIEGPCIEIENHNIPDTIRYCINRYTTSEQLTQRQQEYNLKYMESPSNVSH